MHCPSCDKEITSANEWCTSCGFHFSGDILEKITLCFEIRKETEHIKALVKDELWTGVKNVYSRLDRLEALIEKDLKGTVPLQEKVHVSAAADAVVESEVQADEYGPADVHNDEEPAPEVIAPVPGTMPEPQQFEVKFGQKWLLIIGIVTMVFGVGYFLKYSFEQGWIGPAGRVTMAYLWGMAFLVGGDQFRRRGYETFGLYLAGGGIATLYFSTFAAFQLYALIGQMPAFGVMVMITVLSGVLAVFYDTKWLAVLGTVGGFLTPAMLSTGQDNQIALMTYMTILNLGLLGIAFYKKWDLLSICGFVFTYILFWAWHEAHYAMPKFWPAIIFLNIFYLIYSLMPFAYQFTRKKSERMDGFLVIVPNSILAFGYSYSMITAYAGLQWVSIITIGYALIFLVMASYLYKAGLYEQDAFVVLLGKAALFLVITIPVIFSKHWITVFWTVQAASLLWMAVRLKNRSLTFFSYLLLAVTIGKFLIYDYDVVFSASFDHSYLNLPYTHMLAERLLTSFMVLAAVAFFAYLSKREPLNIVNRMAGDDAALFASISGILLFIVLNMETSMFFRDYLPAARFAALSVLWTIFSVMLMVLGFRNNNKALRKVSLGLFGITLFKTFVFDMSNISTPYRIISFIVLGIVLVGTSYLYHRFRGRIMTAMNSDQN